MTQVTFSAEKQFIHGDSFNRGFVQVPRMIVSCIGLSAEAKAVYSYLSAYIYEHGRSAFPSIHRIAVGSGMAGKSVVKYISELTDKGLVRKESRGRGKTNDYFINDAHDIPLLHVSEMVWKSLDSIMKSDKSNSWDQIEYSLKSISDSLIESGYYYSDISYTDEARVSFECEVISVMNGGKPNLMNILKRPSQVRTAEVGSTNKPNTADFESREETTWTVANFRAYFYRKYAKVTGEDHIKIDTLHAGITNRLLKQLDGDKVALKKHIDTFFDIGYDIKTLEWFGTGGRLAEIQIFIKEGKKPFYLQPKKADAAVKKIEEAKDAKQERQGLGLDELKKLMGR